jgi:8-oxo-dGTP pyrophosphatase MutT (NUDIX family)
MAPCLEARVEEKTAILALVTGCHQGLNSLGPKLVKAAGGVVWRREDSGEVRVLLIHRPKYDDWTFPKGKLDPGEQHEAAALREVAEETGLHCKLGAELASTTYRDRRGRLKQVRYWAMVPIAGAFIPDAEVDEVRWLPLDLAHSWLSYDRDRTVLASLPISPEP